MHKINHLLPVGIISLFCNCSQNHLIENNDEQFINIVAAVEKSIYGEESLTKGIISSVKDEITPTKEEETEASKEIQDAIFYIMQKSMTNFNKTRSEATLLSNDPNEMVGVFQVAAPGSGVVIQPANCGTYREFYFRMDCQDGGFT